MLDTGSEAAPPPPTEPGIKPVDILNGEFGFHYSIDRALPGVMQHGLLSRMEERKRGLQIRPKASRSPGDLIYFTTQVNDLYFLNYSNNSDASIQEQLRDVLGLVIDRPEFVHNEGHFALQNVVDPQQIKALVIVDRITVPKQFEQKRNTHDQYRFKNPLDPAEIAMRVDAIRKMCKEQGRNLPIYGVSGDMYWPNKKVHSDITK